MGMRFPVHPSSSPCLNPIEHVWDHLKREVSSLNPRPVSHNSMLAAARVVLYTIPRSTLGDCRGIACLTMALCDYRSEGGGRTPPRIKRRNTWVGQMETLAPLLPQGSKTDRLRRDAATVLGCVRVRSTPGGGPAGAGVRVEQVACVKGLCVAGLSLPSTGATPTFDNERGRMLAPPSTRSHSVGVVADISHVLHRWGVQGHPLLLAWRGRLRRRRSWFRNGSVACRPAAAPA